jgi:transposase
MPVKKHLVSLTPEEKITLGKLIRTGTHAARTITRARTLMLLNQGKDTVSAAREAGVCLSTARNIRIRYAEGGLERALYDLPRSGQPKKLTPEEEATVTAIACTDPPDGYGRWTLDLLTEKSGKHVKKVGRSTIHRVLMKSDLKPWREKNVVHRED